MLSGPSAAPLFSLPLPSFSLSLRERVRVRGRERARGPFTLTPPHPCPLPEGEGVRPFTPEASFRHVHVLQLRVAFHRRHAEVPADAALLEAAEGGLDVDAAVGVDAQDAALDAPRDAQRPLEVVGPD